MKTQLLFLIFLMVLGIGACVTPIEDFNQTGSRSYLTVEAILTNQVEASKVRLFKSSSELLNTNFKPVQKAIVYFLSDKGEKEILIESADKGLYLPHAKFVGEIGKTYTLYIETPDGVKYQSSPETMKNCPTIEKLISRFEIIDKFGVNDARRTGFNVYEEFQDSPAQADYYQWVWKHYQNANTCANCQNGYYNFRTNMCVNPSPPASLTLNYHCKGNCWDITYSNEINILSDEYFNGQKITGKQVARIPYDSTSNYYLQLERRAITRNTYNYYQALKNQTQDNGTLFDVPSETQFSFNIKSMTKPDEKILGIFDVHSIQKKIIYIDRVKDVPNSESPIYASLQGIIVECSPLEVSLGCEDKALCVESRFRTKIKPEGWRE